MLKISLTLLLALLGPGLAAGQGSCQAPAAKFFPQETFSHVAHCAPLSYPAYPPTAGAHFATVWAVPGTYHLVLSPGYWLHSVEHGAVVFLVNCHLPGNCNEDIAGLQKIADAYPHDSSCSIKDNHRIIIAGDTTIRTRFAVIAANWSLLSDCLDATAFATFLKDHYAHAPEDLCGGGTDFSGTGWCNEPLPIARAAQPPTPVFAGGERILWQGSLTRGGRLTLEARSLKGEAMASYDLGPAGPGSAAAKWDAKVFRSAFPAAGAVLCRLRFSSASGSRVLAEMIDRP